MHFSSIETTGHQDLIHEIFSLFSKYLIIFALVTPFAPAALKPICILRTKAPYKYFTLDESLRCRMNNHFLFRGNIFEIFLNVNKGYFFYPYIYIYKHLGENMNFTSGRIYIYFLIQLKNMKKKMEDEYTFLVKKKKTYKHKSASSEFEFFNIVNFCQ